MFMLRLRLRLLILLMLWLRPLVSGRKDGVEKASNSLGRRMVCAGYLLARWGGRRRGTYLPMCGRGGAVSWEP